MNTFMNALLPQIHLVRGARKVSFWVPAEETSETGMTYLEEVEHDLKIFQKRLDKAMATGVCGQRLELIRRQRDYKRKVVIKLRKATK
ncbi:hypothetical protein UFOVP1109_6 [uncultured Caudovirales phage]|uniref:Uncharacterized protein n=1 Tax=uncultured Caudovirales phage TaxID=2100421 RepID=A0A6J7XH32_9CAUD|nr:hypothetical protein UFOVP1109_6 [uncultured Caudovirales phage]CAB4216015.1 hypothetical protein UFOVP1473_45 [uncultured Caudovirales phage]CAB5230281.1 hypothetical protein UFOVP1560_53 [uncultured Caudovirales phage]